MIFFSDGFEYLLEQVINS